MIAVSAFLYLLSKSTLLIKVESSSKAEATIAADDASRGAFGIAGHHNPNREYGRWTTA